MTDQRHDDATSPAWDEHVAVVTAWNKAIVANDADKIAAFVDPEWVIVSELGILPRDRFLDLVRSGRLVHHSMTSQVHEVRRYGRVAVVISHVQTRGAYDGQPFELDEWNTDVYIRHDIWRCVATQNSVAATPAQEG